MMQHFRSQFLAACKSDFCGFDTYSMIRGLYEEVKFAVLMDEVKSCKDKNADSLFLKKKRAEVISYCYCFCFCCFFSSFFFIIANYSEKSTGQTVDLSALESRREGLARACPFALPSQLIPKIFESLFQFPPNHVLRRRIFTVIR
jgi:hypothetical protein